MMAMNYHLLFKILLVGDREVGKAAILHPAAGDSPLTSSIGVNFLKRKLELDGKRIKLQIWNIAGQESSQALTPSYYHGAQGFMLAYDVTDKTSYDKIPEWLRIIEDYASEEDFQKILVANKCRCHERNRVITKKEGEAFAREYGMRYTEINDLQSSEIDDALKLLIQDILSNAGSTQKAQEKSEDYDIHEEDGGHKMKLKELLLG